MEEIWFHLQGAWCLWKLRWDLWLHFGPWFDLVWMARASIWK
jgi:hypothetical protein